MKNFIRYKGRDLDTSREVAVYRNLKMPGVWYSVMQDGLVVAHVTDITIKNPHFKVRPGGARLAMRTGQRNVHAFVVGRPVPALPSRAAMMDRFYGTYSVGEGFLIRDMGDPLRDPMRPPTWRGVSFAEGVTLGPEGMYIYGPGV